MPTEILQKILRLCIGEHVFQIFTTSSASSEERAAFTSTSLMYRGCGAVTTRRLPALTATCRQLYAEANPILYQKTMMVFSSPRSMSHFFESNEMALASVQRICVHCGPAKHVSTYDKAQNRKAFNMLRHNARQLREMHISFRTYYNIQNDQHLFSNFWLSRLFNLQGLSEMSLHIDLSMLGPVDYISPADGHRLLNKVKDVEEMLRHQLRQGNQSPMRKRTAQQLQKDIVAFTKQRSSARKAMSKCMEHGH